nr:hypothetical protein Iba_chr13fCG10340 [Ipomoea batatas]
MTLRRESAPKARKGKEDGGLVRLTRRRHSCPPDGEHPRRRCYLLRRNGEACTANLHRCSCRTERCVPPGHSATLYCSATALAGKGGDLRSVAIADRPPLLTERGRAPSSSSAAATAPHQRAREGEGSRRYCRYREERRSPEKEDGGLCLLLAGTPHHADTMAAVEVSPETVAVASCHHSPRSPLCFARRRERTTSLMTPTNLFQPCRF